MRHALRGDSVPSSAKKIREIHICAFDEVLIITPLGKRLTQGINGDKGSCLSDQDMKTKILCNLKKGATNLVCLKDFLGSGIWNEKNNKQTFLYSVEKVMILRVTIFKEATKPFPNRATNQIPSKTISRQA